MQAAKAAGTRWSAPLQRRVKLGAEGVFVEADFGGVAGEVVDGEDVEAAGRIGDVALGEKMLGGANYDALLVGGDAELGEGSEFFAERAGADFDESESFAVVADEVDFAFGGTGRVVTRDEDVTAAAEIPVGVGFAADAGAACGVFAVIGGAVVIVVAEAFAGGPADQEEDAVGKQRHSGGRSIN